MVVFVESRISGHKVDGIIASFSFLYSHRIEANGFSGGIWIAWHDSIKVEVILNHFQFVHCHVTDKCDGSSALAMVIYASPNSTKSQALWSNLRQLASSIFSPWICFGDFNATLCSSDCMGGSPSMKLKSSEQHLLRMKWDHRPIFSQVGGIADGSSSSPFWYFSSWSSHNDFDRMVADNWVPSSTLSETIISFTKAEDTWNKTVYGYIGIKKRIVMAHLRGVQKALCTKSSQGFFV
ncbi:hypothetical protein V6N13_099148 [Hibiscus sabdariffa]